MKIGIDIDGVLTNSEQFIVDYFTKYCIENNIQINTNGIIDYSLAKTFNVSVDIENDFWEKYLKFYSINEKPRAFASEIIQKLKNDGHEIYIITARCLNTALDKSGKNMKKIVKTWLSENKIIYDKLIFSEAKNEEKLTEIKENNIDLMIEDNPNNIKQLSEIIPVICYNTTYNANCAGKNIIRCYSWYDIYSKINKKGNYI